MTARNLSENLKHSSANCLTAFLVFSVYAVIALLWTWPLLQKISISMVGTGGDRYIFLWNFWWFGHTFSETGSNLLSTSYLFFPAGTHLAFHSLSLVTCLLSFLLQIFFSALESYNLVYVLSFPLAGLTMYMLSREVDQSTPGAFTAGLIYSFWAGHWAHLEQLNLVSIQFIPLYVVMVRRWTDPEHILAGKISRILTRAAVTGFVLAVNCLTCWYYGFYLFFLSVICWGWTMVRIVRNKARGSAWSLTRRLILSLMSFCLGYFLIIGPLYAPIMGELVNSGNVGSATVLLDSSARLEAIFVPNVTHPLYGHWLSRLYQRLSFPVIWGFEGCLFLGYTALALALIGFLTRPGGEKWLWVTVFVFFLVLSLGPRLVFLNRVINLTLPYDWLTALPLMSFLRVPSRAIVLSVVMIALLAGQGSQFLFDTFRGTRQYIFLTLVCVLILGEYVRYPTPMIPPESCPRTYRDLGAVSSERAILTLSDQMHEARKSLYFQTIHHKPITLGFTSHITDRALGCFNLYAVIEALFLNKPLPPINFIQKNGPDSDGHNVRLSIQGHLAGLLNEYKIGWVTLYPNFWVPNTPRSNWYLTKELGYPVEIDPLNALSIYEVPQRSLPGSFLLMGKGFGTYDRTTGMINCLDGATLILFNMYSWKYLDISFRLVTTKFPFSIVVQPEHSPIISHNSKTDRELHQFLVPLRPGLNHIELRLDARNKTARVSAVLRRSIGGRPAYQPDQVTFTIADVTCQGR